MLIDPPTVTLFGYQDQKLQVQTCIQDEGTLRFVCLHGQGGMGKTTMLRAMQELYADDPKYCISDLLDFDEWGLHIVLNVLDRIVKGLRCSDDLFGEYRVEAERLRKLTQSPNPSRLLAQEYEEHLIAAFLQDYQIFSATQRVVLLFDTVEKVQDFPFFSELIKLLLQLTNSAILLSGREGPKLREMLLKNGATAGSVSLVTLGGLNQDDSLEYFKRSELGQFLANENLPQARLVCYLSGGRPILIDLAVDWLGQGMDLPKLPKSLDSLDEPAKQTFQKQFERGLVQQVNDLGEPRNELILEMAHVFHYFNIGRLRYLHPDTSPERAALHFDELRHFSFIKLQPGGGLRLHDEMSRMINEYVWPALDVSGDRRRWLSNKMVVYYQQQLEEYKDDEVRWQPLRAELLYHQLYADAHQGLKTLDPDFRTALAQQNLGFAEVLLNTVKLFAESFDLELNAWYDVHKGRLLRAEEKVEDAIKLILPAKDVLHSLEIKGEMDMVHNALGYCYRLQGDWEKAIDAYEEALYYSRLEGDAEQIAETMNNIANVCRLSGDFERATRYSLVGLYVRERLKNDRALGNSCYVRGMVSWEIGNTAESAAYLKRARDLFTKVGYEDGIAEVDYYESYIYFRIGDLENSIPRLKRAQAVYQEKGNGPGQAESLNLEARILIDKFAIEGDTEQGFQDIKVIARRALKVAERIHDYYKISECHLTLCRLYYRWGRFYKNQGDKENALRYFTQAHVEYDHAEGGQLARLRNYRALLSVYEWCMGDLNYELQEWDQAFRHYLQESALSARQKSARLFRALNGLSFRLHALPADEDGIRRLTLKYCDYVIDGWNARGLAVRYPEVIEECEAIKTFLGLVDPGRLDYLHKWGASLLDRGEWERATKVYQQLLETNLAYRPSEQIAEAMNRSAWAYRQLGNFSQARRLCNQSMMLRQAQGAPAPLADSHLTMGSILWNTGNAAEAGREFRMARKLYEQADDEVGLARVRRHLAFLYFRINDYEQAETYITPAIQLFRERYAHADLADALNLHQRILLRMNRLTQESRVGEEPRRLAEQNGLHYSLAETWLTISNYEMSLAHQETDQKQVKVHLQRALQAYQSGVAIAEKYNYLLLLSVYRAIAGDLAFKEERYADAFEFYLQDLISGMQYEPARMWRELDRILAHLVGLKEPLRSFYADYMITEWKARGLAEQAPGLHRLFRLLKEYSQYV
jgi:tetratricopeptide (TPR) repeat protein